MWPLRHGRIEMYIDKELLVWDAAALTVDAASTNAIDLSSVTPKIDIGAGEPMMFILQVDVSADFTSSNETYQFNVIDSDNADLSSPRIMLSRLIDYSLLTAGTLHDLPVPAVAVAKRYLGLYFDGGNTTPTITVTAWLSLRSMFDRQHTYAKGYVVS